MSCHFPRIPSTRARRSKIGARMLTSDASRKSSQDLVLMPTSNHLCSWNSGCCCVKQSEPLRVFPLLQGPDFCIAHEDFLRLALPSLSDLDAVLLVYTHSGEREHAWLPLFWVPSKPNRGVSWRPLSLSADDVGDVVKLARRVREQTSNIHAVYHQVDGDTAAAVQQVSIYLSIYLSI